MLPNKMWHNKFGDPRGQHFSPYQISISKLNFMLINKNMISDTYFVTKELNIIDWTRDTFQNPFPYHNQVWRIQIVKYKGIIEG